MSSRSARPDRRRRTTMTSGGTGMRRTTSLPANHFDLQSRPRGGRKMGGRTPSFMLRSSTGKPLTSLTAKVVQSPREAASVPGRRLSTTAHVVAALADLDDDASAGSRPNSFGFNDSPAASVGKVSEISDDDDDGRANSPSVDDLSAEKQRRQSMAAAATAAMFSRTPPSRARRLSGSGAPDWASPLRSVPADARSVRDVVVVVVWCTQSQRCARYCWADPTLGLVCVCARACWLSLCARVRVCVRMFVDGTCELACWLAPCVLCCAVLCCGVCRGVVMHACRPEVQRRGRVSAVEGALLKMVTTLWCGCCAYSMI